MSDTQDSGRWLLRKTIFLNLFFYSCYLPVTPDFSHFMVCACTEETSEWITAVSLSFPLCVCVYVSNLSPVSPHCHHCALIYYMVWFCQQRYQPKSLLWERKEDGESRKNNQFSLIECFLKFYFTHEICIVWMKRAYLVEFPIFWNRIGSLFYVSQATLNL